MADVSSLVSLIQQRAVELVREASAEVARETADRARVGKTNQLADSVEVSPPVNLGRVVSATITAQADHAKLYAEGSPSHEIRARVKKALAFELHGRRVVVRSVQHPGTKPHPAWWSVETLAQRWRAALDRQTS